jgi:hypothetical protein
MDEWRPLIDDAAKRETIVATIREIAGALAAWHAEPDVRSIDELVDHALFRAYIADIVPDDDVEGIALARAVDAVDRAGLGLCGGVARVGWLLAHLAAGDDVEVALAAIDVTLTRHLDSGRYEFDIVSGLAGIGVYALERGDAGRALAERVVVELERSARPRAGGVAWFTPFEELPPWHQVLAPGGYWNLGLAHGTPGPIALLARCVAADVAADRARALLAAAVPALLAVAPASPGGRFGSWHHASGEVLKEKNGRLAWCYGDLGVTVALVAAARATGDAAWLDEALALARDCAARTLEKAFIFDAALCHGAAGVAHLFHRLAVASADAAIAAAARTWIDRTLAMRNSEPLAGFPMSKFDTETGSRHWRPNATLLEGACGVALALHAAISVDEPLWDRLLLADL